MIYVYTPSFPEQTIPTKPELIITLKSSGLGLTGFLDPSRPHAVNHLIVGDLGDEEVVVVACDDGDVLSYTVRSISLAIKERAKHVSGPDPYGDQGNIRSTPNRWTNKILPVIDSDLNPGCRTLTAWFHENVGLSAWGLATHKHARLLAVSSNTQDIQVFAPSLSSERDGVLHQTCLTPESIQRFTAWENGSATALADRSIGRIVTLQGHTENIPSVAFCDNVLDLKGRYLVSTDIDGYTIIWDIWQRTQVIQLIDSCGPRE